VFQTEVTLSKGQIMKIYGDKLSLRETLSLAVMWISYSAMAVTSAWIAWSWLA
jgi:hypothetical protein